MCIVTRDRTPVNSSDSETDSDSGNESGLGRIIVPPNVNCVVRDIRVTQSLPTVLNAKVSPSFAPSMYGIYDSLM